MGVAGLYPFGTKVDRTGLGFTVFDYGYSTHASLTGTAINTFSLRTIIKHAQGSPIAFE